MTIAETTAPERRLVGAARAGFTTKGLLHALVGVLAVQAAIGKGGDTTGTDGALATIGAQPFGRILLGLVALGLAAYAIWRLVEAWRDPLHDDGGAKAVFRRIGYVISAAIYGSLAFAAARGAWQGHTPAGGDGERQAWTARAMSEPFGRWLVGLVGAVIVGVGIMHFVKAWKTSFTKHQDTRAMSAAERDWTRRLGRFGLAARGVTFVIAGQFLIVAAWRFDPSRARGLVWHGCGVGLVGHRVRCRAVRAGWGWP